MSDPVDGKFYGVLKAVQTALTAALPTVPHVDLFEGELDLEGIKAIMQKPRTLQVAFLGTESATEHPGGPITQFASYAVYTSTDGKHRNREALNLMEAVAAVATKPDFLSIPFVLPPVVGNIENLYSSKSGVRGVALYGISIGIPILFEDAIMNDLNQGYDPANLTFGFEGEPHEPLEEVPDAEA